MLPCSTRHILAVLSLALLLLEGCGSTPPTRFYVLPTLTDASPPAAAGKRELTIGIGPMTLPRCVEIISRRYRLKYLEMAPLDDRGSKRWTCAQMSAKRLGRRVENAF
jgi:hypothetical protein